MGARPLPAHLQCFAQSISPNPRPHHHWQLSARTPIRPCRQVRHQPALPQRDERAKTHRPQLAKRNHRAAHTCHFHARLRASVLYHRRQKGVFHHHPTISTLYSLTTCHRHHHDTPAYYPQTIRIGTSISSSIAASGTAVLSAPP